MPRSSHCVLNQLIFIHVLTCSRKTRSFNLWKPWVPTKCFQKEVHVTMFLLFSFSPKETIDYGLQINIPRAECFPLGSSLFPDLHMGSTSGVRGRLGEQAGRKDRLRDCRDERSSAQEKPPSSFSTYCIPYYHMWKTPTQSCPSLVLVKDRQTKLNY